MVNPEDYRINGLLLIRMLYVIRKGGAKRDDLVRVTQLSQGSVTRMLQAARTQFGCDILWDHRNMEYRIGDWGVFNPEVFGPDPSAGERRQSDSALEVE